MKFDQALSILTKFGPIWRRTLGQLVRRCSTSGQLRPKFVKVMQAWSDFGLRHVSRERPTDCPPAIPPEGPTDSRLTVRPTGRSTTLPTTRPTSAHPLHQPTGRPPGRPSERPAFRPTDIVTAKLDHTSVARRPLLRQVSATVGSYDMFRCARRRPSGRSPGPPQPKRSPQLETFQPTRAPQARRRGRSQSGRRIS